MPLGHPVSFAHCSACMCNGTGTIRQNHFPSKEALTIYDDLQDTALCSQCYLALV